MTNTIYTHIRLIQCNELLLEDEVPKPPIFQAIVKAILSNIKDNIMSTIFIPTIEKPVIKIYNVPTLSPPQKILSEDLLTG